MKILFILLFTTVSISGFAQATDAMQQKKDSVKNEIKQQLSISQAKADSVSNILAWSSNEIVTIAQNKALTKEQRLSQITSVAALRDQKIAALLTLQQVQQLKNIMAAHKQQIKNNRSNKLKQKQ